MKPVGALTIYSKCHNDKVWQTVISQEEKSLDYSTICHKMFQVHPTIDGSSNEESANKQITSICKKLLNKKKKGGGVLQNIRADEKKKFF